MVIGENGWRAAESALARPLSPLVSLAAPDERCRALVPVGGLFAMGGDVDQHLPDAGSSGLLGVGPEGLGKGSFIEGDKDRGHEILLSATWRMPWLCPSCVGFLSAHRLERREDPANARVDGRWTGVAPTDDA